MEGGPFTGVFAAQVALFINPSLRAEFFGVGAPHFGASSLGVRAPAHVVTSLDDGAVGPNVIFKSVLLIGGDRGVQTQRFVKAIVSVGVSPQVLLATGTATYTAWRYGILLMISYSAGESLSASSDILSWISSIIFFSIRGCNDKL